jgi:ADP-ribosylglycohydrolase
MAGGDSASRGIIVGGILGYVHGVDAIPKAWRDVLHALPC